MRLEIRCEEPLRRGRVGPILQVRAGAACAERPGVERHDRAVVEQRPAGVAEADARRDLQEPIWESVVLRDDADVSVAANAIVEDERSWEAS